MRMSEDRIARVASPALDELIGQRLAVLDDGFVRVVDYMGGDESIVQAARVSYGAGTKQVREDRGLIRYLMRHRHTTPFEMCEIKLHVRVPMDTWRQWIRHRTANVNEYSTRYSVAIDSAQRTDPAEWRSQSANNRQGSSTNLDVATGKALSAREAQVQEVAREVYQERIAKGVAREQARKDLPLSTYTEAYWKIDLHNLLHFIELRLDARAQQEIRAYATVLGETVVRAWCPVAWEAFVDYRLASMSLSRQEIALVRALLTDPGNAPAVARESGLLKAAEGNPAPTREGKEAAGKLASLGFAVPWSSATE
jgi:thymidylate synthase (FAD)